MKTIIAVLISLVLILIVFAFPSNLYSQDNEHLDERPPVLHKSGFLDPIFNYRQTHRFPDYVWDDVNEEWDVTNWSYAYAVNNTDLNGVGNNRFGYDLLDDLGLTHTIFSPDSRQEIYDDVKDQDLGNLKVILNFNPTIYCNRWNDGNHDQWGDLDKDEEIWNFGLHPDGTPFSLERYQLVARIPRIRENIESRSLIPQLELDMFAHSIRGTAYK